MLEQRATKLNKKGFSVALVVATAVGITTIAASTIKPSDFQWPQFRIFKHQVWPEPNQGLKLICLYHIALGPFFAVDAVIA